MKVRVWTIIGLAIVTWLAAYQFDAMRLARLGASSAGSSVLFATYCGADVLVAGTLVLFLTPALIREMIGDCRSKKVQEEGARKRNLCCARCGSFDLASLDDTSPMTSTEPDSLSFSPIAPPEARNGTDSSDTSPPASARRPILYSGTSSKGSPHPVPPRPLSRSHDRNDRAKKPKSGWRKAKSLSR